ncbi:hypothetical protein ACE6H2_004808 [Prunus campanulata]
MGTRGEVKRRRTEGKPSDKEIHQCQKKQLQVEGRWAPKQEQRAKRSLPFISMSLQISNDHADISSLLI